jgi:Uncharacterized protein conserved in bacteria (DUF2066)
MILYLRVARRCARAVKIMSRPGQKSTTAIRRARALLLAASCALCCAAPLSSWAGRPVRVYEADVDGQSPAALQGAMRQVLVRATGRREAAEDPALAGLVSDAAKYLKTYATGARGELQAVFDGAAVEQAIGASGRSLWDHERPFTLVVLTPPRERAAAAAAGTELERVAAERGLPISMVPLAVVDGQGNLLPADAMLRAAEHYGADEILVGRGDGAQPDSELQWTLYTRAASSSWSGPLAAGIDHSVDLLVPQQASAAVQTETPVRVRIEGVTTLADYTALERLLGGVAAVRRANIAAADAGGISFEVMVRGGVAALQQGLTGARLELRDTKADRIVYHYQP